MNLWQNIKPNSIFPGKVNGWAKSEVESNAKIIKAVCLPIYTILSAVGNPVVDFFSLDVEGAELEILKTIPWDKVHIKVCINTPCLFLSNKTHIV